jgi:hypothetical protein
MKTTLTKGKKLLKKLTDKAAGTRVGRQVMKIPAPIRKGYAAGLLVPVPGAGEVGALVGTGVWAKGRLERAVTARTGQPYRMFDTPGRLLVELMATWDGKSGGTASPKLDGVYARATKDGVFSRSGKPLDLPHVSSRLKRHFRKNPDAVLEGEVFKKGEGIEKIAGAVKSGGVATKHLKLHLFPKDGEKRPWSIGAVRRVPGKKVTDAAGVQQVFQKALKRGHEGVVVRGADGTPAKLKPVQDAEWEVAQVHGGPRGVLALKHGDRTFKVQSKPGLTAKAGDKVQVTYSGTTKKGVPKAAVAQRVRNDHDFETMKPPTPFQTPAMLLLGDAFPTPDPCVRAFRLRAATPGQVDLARGETTEEEIARDRRTLKRIAAGAAVAGGVAATVIHKGRTPKVVPVAKPPVKLKKPVKTYWGMKPPPRVKVKLEAGKIGQIRQIGRIRPISLEEKRDPLSKARDATIIAGTGAVGAGALVTAHQARKLRKKADAALGHASSAVARTARQVRETVTPKAVAHEGLKLVKDKAKSKAVEYFPTFTKGIRALKKTVFQTPAQRLMDFSALSGSKAITREALGLAPRKVVPVLKTVKKPPLFEVINRKTKEVVGHGTSKHSARRVRDRRDNEYGGYAHSVREIATGRSFQTPAQQMGLFNFATATADPKIRDSQRRFVDHWDVAAGLKKGYDATGAEAKVGMGDAAVIKSLYRKANTVNKWGGRAGRLTKDAADVVRGVPRARDTSGRKKSREWEKGWAKDAAKKALLVGGGIAYGIGLKKSPRLAATHHRVVGAAKKAGREVKDAISNFETPAARMGISFGISNIEHPTLNFERKRKEDNSAAIKAGLGGAVAGGANGALIGSLSAAGSKQADDYFGILKKREARGHGGGVMVAPKKPSAPFKAKGKFNNAEKIARAEHNSLQNMKKVIRRRSIGGGLAGAALLGGASYAVTKTAEKKRFSTPASGILRQMETSDGHRPPLQFDEVAADAGWDIRDPRGKSARVFAPGSRKRVRREKSWSEEVGNERKLWKAGVVGAALLAGAGGVAIGRRLPKKGFKKVESIDSIRKRA